MLERLKQERLLCYILRLAARQAVSTPQELLDVVAFLHLSEHFE
jgi:hypothetical protein